MRAPRGGPRGGRAGLHGRRQPERDPGPVPARRGRLRRHALQRPQDVLHAARRRRPGGRPGRRAGAARSRSCPAPRVLREPDGTFRLERPGERPAQHRPGARPTWAASASSCAPTPTSGPTAARASARSATTPSWPPTTCKAPRLAARSRCRIDAALQARVRRLGASLKRATGVRTLDVAKRLIDKGYHPPTIYFPLHGGRGDADRADRDGVGSRRSTRSPRRSWRSPGRRTRHPSWSCPRRTRRRSAGSTRRPRRASRTCAGGRRFRPPRDRAEPRAAAGEPGVARPRIGA